MRNICLLAASVFVTQAASAESLRAETCRKDADVRTIEVISPGTVGLACDVVYARDGGANVAVPYNANVDKDFCRARAAELAASLAADGFDCSTSASQSVEASLAGGAPGADTVADAGADAAVVPADAPLDAQLKQLEIADAATPIEPLADTELAPLENEPEAVATREPEEALEQPQAIITAEVAAPETAAEPAAPAFERPAPAEPVQLAADARISEYRAPKPPKAKGPGRLVGAQPSIEDIIDASTAPNASPKPAQASGEIAQPGRAASEIIRGVLAANAAAWNEGNLEAFMGGYQTGADVLLVKNTLVTTGWRDIRKSYEQDIAAHGGMGRLTFTDIDVTLTSPEVATVIGRYALARGGADATGVLTLVMKQIDGRWRIVQDTRVADAALKP
ncbi:MAG: nuclear transport factor 2 family protein [Pseudomonadota bacterium]